jgi:hypothetical protein
MITTVSGAVACADSFNAGLMNEKPWPNAVEGAPAREKHRSANNPAGRTNRPVKADIPDCKTANLAKVTPKLKNRPPSRKTSGSRNEDGQVEIYDCRIVSSPMN